jgi:hypothetical protein
MRQFDSDCARRWAGSTYITFNFGLSGDPGMFHPTGRRSSFTTVSFRNR